MNKQGCRVTQIRSAMTEEEATALDKLLASPTSSERIALILTQHGWKISYQTIRRHITGICHCEES